MKKLLTLLLTLSMIFSLVGCNSKENTPIVNEPEQQQEVVEPIKEDEPIVGGFVDAEDKTITDELKDIFNKALDSLTGAKYEPVELVATQVVAGTNYKFLANGTKTTNPITKGTYYITIYKDLKGNVELKDIEVIEEKQEETPKQDVTQMSFWVVFYDQYGNELQREALKYGTVPEYKSWLPEGFDKWVYKKSQKDVDSFKAITGNTYYQAVCHEVYHSSDSGSDPSPTPSPIPSPTPGPTPPTVPEGFVDLGITSGGNPLYWAKCNLGANNPEEPGDYYMWGTTTLMYSAVDVTMTDNAFTFVTSNPYGSNFMNTWDSTKGFSWNNTPFTNGVYNSPSQNVFTKYTEVATYAKSGTPDNILTLESGDDAATATNSSWRIPTKNDFDDLASNCVLFWTSDYNETGKSGYIVYKAKNENDKGKAKMNLTWKMWDAENSKYINNTDIEPTGYDTPDDHIFLPVTRYGEQNKLNNFETRGAYWTSTLDSSYNDKAESLIFVNTNILLGQNTRSYGYTIRPVTE